jgi:hypothetical protein
VVTLSLTMVMVIACCGGLRAGCAGVTTLREASCHGWHIRTPVAMSQRDQRL